MSGTRAFILTLCYIIALFNISSCATFKKIQAKSEPKCDDGSEIADKTFDFSVGVPSDRVLPKQLEEEEMWQLYERCAALITGRVYHSEPILDSDSVPDEVAAKGLDSVPDSTLDLRADSIPDLTWDFRVDSIPDSELDLKADSVTDSEFDALINENYEKTLKDNNSLDSYSSDDSDEILSDVDETGASKHQHHKIQVDRIHKQSNCFA